MTTPVILSMPYPPEDAHLVEVYQRVGSVHRAAAELGMSHSRLHRRLTKLGAMKGVHFTAEERASIRSAYEAAGDGPVDLSALSKGLGRRRNCIARIAGEMGLTNGRRAKSTDARRALEAGRDAHFKANGHPKGFAGQNHSADAKAVMSTKSRDAWLVAKTFNVGAMAPDVRQRKSDAAVLRNALAPAENAYSRAKHGRREDLDNIFFRSAWEANYARYLNWLKARGDIIGWEYEPVTFWFEKIRRGVRSYKPDFRVTEANQTYFVEVKGWMDPKSKTKLARMKRYHPDVEVRLVGERQYREIASKLGRLISGWEGAR